MALAYFMQSPSPPCTFAENEKKSSHRRQAFKIMLRYFKVLTHLLITAVRIQLLKQVKQQGEKCFNIPENID